MFPDFQTPGMEIVPKSDSGISSAPSAGDLPPDPERQATIGELIPYFLAHAKLELRFSPESLAKYQDCLGWIVRWLGDIPPQKMRQEHVLLIKARCAQRHVGASRVSSMIYTLKSFLKFCRLTLGVETIDVRDIKAPRLPKREVVYLTPEEVQQYVSAIPLRKGPRTFDMRWLMFRALVEVLLGTGMRISEALSLQRSSVNFQTGEATVIGKGNKQRVVFFSPRALNWLKEYLSHRRDECDTLFVGAWGRPIGRAYVVQLFRRVRHSVPVRLQKKVSAHVLRHTLATNLLFNGCPIAHIKEILGHERLTTTCDFYLGSDKRRAKQAHADYLNYDVPPSSPP
jgi:site-specific recombinase XerD